MSHLAQIICPFLRQSLITETRQQVFICRHLRPDLRSQSFTSLIAVLRQEINTKFPHLSGFLMEHFLEGIASACRGKMVH